jgi:hypothetical protein
MSNKDKSEKPVGSAEIIQLIKNYGWELIKFSWLIAILAFMLGYYMYRSKKSIPAEYAAYLSFSINENSGADQSFLQQVLGGGISLNMIDADMGLGSGNNGMAMLQELMKTRKTMELVLFKKVTLPDISGKLKDDYFIHHFVELNGIRAKWKKEKNPLADVYFTHDSIPAFSREQNSILGLIHYSIIKKQLSDNLSKAGILTLKFKSVNEQLSFNFLRVFYDELNSYYTSKSIEKQQRIYKAAVARRDSLEKEMDLAEKDYISYLNTHNLAAMGQHAEEIEIQYLGRKLSGEMEAYFMAIRNVETAKIALEQHTPLLQAIDKPMYPLGRDVPNAFMALVMGVAIGSFLGIILVLGRKAYIDIVIHKKNPLKIESAAKEESLSADNSPKP